MSGFLPALPAGGLVGWSFLSRTAGAQKAAHAASPVQSREAAYFREKIGTVTSAAELVADRRLLSVALTAFGLQDDLPNKFFIRRVLESDPSDPRALAFRLADSRYGELARAFGFTSLFGPATTQRGFADRILPNFQARSFEADVGAQEPDMRLMLGLERELGTVLRQTVGADARWFAVLGTPPLRSVFQTALGFPDGFGALDLDRQLVEFRTRAEAQFGTSNLVDFAAPEMLDKLRQRYLLQGGGGQSLPSSPALALLSGNAGSAGSTGILETLYGS
jgi:hypothetical protein